MEKAVLKTIILFDIENYPLTIYEIHKWLISKKANLRQVEKALKKLLDQNLIKRERDYYFLSDRKSLVQKRFKKEEEILQSQQTSHLASLPLKLNPAVKFIALDFNGSLVQFKEEISFKKDLLSAKKILSLKLIWQRKKEYLNFLEKNSWVFKYFPNWVTPA